MKNRRFPIDEFLKDVFVENSAKVPATNDASSKTSKDENNFKTAVDDLIDACRKKLRSS